MLTVTVTDKDGRVLGEFVSTSQMSSVTKMALP